MDFVIVGAGAVGTVLGVLLENAGHRVQFWVRPNRRADAGALTIERFGGEPRRIERPRLVCAGDPPPSADWIVVCVRGEQLTAALTELARWTNSQQRVAIAAVSLHGVTAQARAAGVTGSIYALHAAFGSFADDEAADHFHWFPFVPPTTVTPDGDRSRRDDAEQLARRLREAGLPTRAALDMNASMRLMVALNSVLALGWDLSEWRLDSLVRDRSLRRQTARAMQETVSLVSPRSWLRFCPSWAYEVTLRIIALFMGDKGRMTWLVHGPKIRAQTDAIVREIAAASSAETPAPVLSKLFERWRAAREGSRRS
jgi:2-dehydropantoate 2-reductase